MEREIRFKLDEENIMHLLKGKRIEYQEYDMPRVIIEPPQGQITMSYEEFDRLKKMASIVERPYELMEFLQRIEELSSKLKDNK